MSKSTLDNKYGTESSSEIQVAYNATIKNLKQHFGANRLGEILGADIHIKQRERVES